MKEIEVVYDASCAPASGTGSHADAPSPDGLGPSGFDPSLVRVITLRSVIREIPNSWLKQYAHMSGKTLPWSGRPHSETAAALAAVDTEACSAQDINTIIGNNSWATLCCDLCGQEKIEVYRLGDEPDYEARWQDICGSCLELLASMVRDRDRSGGADETAQQAQPEARARAEGIAQ